MAKKAAKVEGEEVTIYSKNENKTMEVNKADFEREKAHFQSVGNTRWDWEIVSE